MNENNEKQYDNSKKEDDANVRDVNRTDIETRRQIARKQKHERRLQESRQRTDIIKKQEETRHE